MRLPRELMSEADRAVDQLYDQAAAGNIEAANFLRLFHRYSHRIDDFLDEAKADSEEFLSILADANILYSLPYYVRHAHRLHLIVASLTSQFADSIAWAKDREQWRREWADKLRFSGNDMVLAVAWIEGGWPLMRTMSPLVKEISHHCHHAEDGSPE